MQILRVNRKGLALFGPPFVVDGTFCIPMRTFQEGALIQEAAALPTLKAVSITSLLLFFDIFLFKCTQDETSQLTVYFLDGSPGMPIYVILKYPRQ